MKNKRADTPCNEIDLKICEFLPREYKRRLLETASVDDLVAIGYARGSAYNAKALGIISDICCDNLVLRLGKRALPIVKEALDTFAQHVSELERQLNSGSGGSAIAGSSGASANVEEEDDGVEEEE